MNGPKSSGTAAGTYRAGRFEIELGTPLWQRPGEDDAPPVSEAARMILCLSGHGSVELDGLSFAAERGTVIYADRRSAVRWTSFSPQETRLFCVPFVPREAPPAPGTGGAHAPRLAALLASGNGAIGRDVSLCEYSDFVKRRVPGEADAGLGGVLFGFLLDAALAVSRAYDARTDRERVIRYVRDNARQNLSVADLARFLSMSERALFNFFRANFHTSPRNFINRIRISAASEALARGLTVREVSEIFRFSGAAAFCRTYRHFFGMTPGEYRKHVAEGGTPAADAPPAPAADGKA